ncbi:MAG: hypothetical protein HY235_29340 [Acidobacteria bacterium]|nr:hypothetical protein [Acidobacteriota bacterium]
MTTTGLGQVVDGNLYWRVNPSDSAVLLSRYDTVPEFSAATSNLRPAAGFQGFQRHRRHSF